MLEDLDTSIGRILDTVEELKLSEKTYLVFTSDNGVTARQFPHFNKPLRAGKGSYYEGGIRVPFVAVGPGIEAGSYSKVPIVGYDLLPTFAELAGSSKPLPEELEGGSFKSVLVNNGLGSVTRSRKGIYFSRQVDAVLIQENLKLIRTHNSGQVQLYNLAEDLSEENDLSQSQPETTERLHQELKDWMEANDVMTPTPHSPRGRRRQ